MPDFPHPIETGNFGDGSPLTLGDPEQLADLFVAGSGSSCVLVNVIDFDGDGRIELVGSSGSIFTFKMAGSLPDGTPIVDRGLRWGATTRAPHRDRAPEDDLGLCGSVLTKGDFDGDGFVETIIGPQSIGTGPIMAVSPESGKPSHRTNGKPIAWKSVDLAGMDRHLAAVDWNGDGLPDLVALVIDPTGYEPIDSATNRVPANLRDRYTNDGQWKGTISGWSLHLLRNTGKADQFEFTYAGPLKCLEGPGPFKDAAGSLCAVDPDDSSKGLLLVGYYGDLWYLDLLESGGSPKWGAPIELLSLHGTPFTRNTSFTSIDTGDLCGVGRADLVASDNSSNIYWCRYRGDDKNGRPIYDDPRKIKQRDPHVNGGFVSVPTTGDWRGTGIDDLVVGGVEGYVLWYRTLSTDPLQFAPPERVRVGDEEIRRYGTPNPSGGHHWGSSQGPDDGFNGGYSNPLLVDWDGDGLLDLLIGDMIGLYDWYPNRGTTTRPKLDPPLRLHCDSQTLLGPWRVRPGAADFSGDGLPDLVTMDADLDLSLFRRAGRDDLTALLPGVKLRYEDGDVIKTHGICFAGTSGDGRGRTKIEIVDWDHNGRWDLILGVGPQYFSAFRASYLLLSRNIGTNEEPLFKRPEILLFDDAGEPLEFWRHGVHPAVVDWDGDGNWEIVVGADKGMIWYFKPDHFGTSNEPGGPNPARDADDNTL